MGQLHEVRHTDEDQTTDQGNQHDRPWNGAARIAGFLGQGADRVEAQEGVAGNGRATHHQRHLHLAIEERRQSPQRLAGVTAHIMDRQGDKGHQYQKLHQHQQRVDAIGQAQTDDIDQAGDDDKGQYPNRLRYRGKRRVEVGRADQPDRHRQKQIVEQYRPAGDKAEFRADSLTHIAIGRAGHRKGRGHATVTHGREEHCHQRREIGGRHPALRGLSEDAEGAEDNDRRHVGDAEQHHRAQRKGALQTSHEATTPNVIGFMTEPSSAKV